MSVSSKFHAALAKPIVQRCYDLEKLFEETNIKELQAVFPALVENIFGFNNQAGWSLLQTCKSRLYNDYTTLTAFLAPTGTLFRLLYKLLCDEYQRYEFSFSCLPHPTRMKFEDGNVPNMYRPKLQTAYPGQVQNSLWLNAFDLYFFHFAFYITNNSACKASTADSPSENLYFSLLEAYLEYFLPLRGKEVPPMPHEASPVRGPILHHSHGTMPRSPQLSYTRQQLNSSQYSEHSSSPPSVSRYPSLIRQSYPFHVNNSPSTVSLSSLPSSASVASVATAASVSGNVSLIQHYHPYTGHARPYPQHPPPSHPHHHHPHHQYGMDGDYRQQDNNWRTESFIEALVEFWLNQNNMAELHEMHTLPSPARKERSLISVLMQDHYLPSVDQVRCCRMLVKHVHYFVNSLQPSQYHTVNTTSLDELKRTIWPCYIQKRLYVFLKHGFKKWPLDSSFRMMLETWLSYIQPWRYTDPAAVEREDRPDDNPRPVGAKFTNFVRDNLLFYSELFQDLLVRIGRTDLCSARNAFMLYRVAKIYGGTDIADMIERAESEFLEPIPRSTPTRPSTDSSGCYPTTRLHESSSATVLLTLQSSELENSTFVYRVLFTESTKQQVEQLLCVVAQAQLNLDNPSAKTSSDLESGNSFLSWFGLSPLQDYSYTLYPGRDDVTDVRKTKVHLDQSTSLLKRLFQIDEGRLNELNQSCQSDRSANESLNQPSKPLPPDHVITDGGPRLTPLGRYQVMSGLRRLPVLYNGDPELRPIVSHENAALVRFFYCLSTRINQQFSEQLSQLYNRNTFGARMLRQLILPPYKPGGATPQKMASSPRQPQTPLQRKLAENPRVSLRFLASYRTLFYVALLYFIAYVWCGLGTVGFVIVLSFVVVIYAAFKAQFTKLHVD